MAAEIRRQVELYFSDANFRRDKFLQKASKEGKDGFVPIATLLTFNLLKALTTDAAAVIDAVKGSEVVVTSEDGLGIKRAKPLPEQDDSKQRTIFVKPLPTEPNAVTWQAVRDAFAAFGTVDFVRLRRTPERKFDGTCFVEFAAAESAAKAIAAAAEGAEGVEFPAGSGKKLEVVSLADFLKANAAERKAKAKAAREKGEQKAAAAAKEEQKMVPNLIVRVANLPVGVDPIEAKEALKEHSKVAYLELEKAATKKEEEGEEAAAAAATDGADAPNPAAATTTTSALVRFKSEEEQADFVEKCAAGTVEVNGNVVSAVLVQGDEEKAYWERLWAARPAAGRGGGRGGGGGGRRGDRRKRNRDDGPSANDGGGDAKVVKKSEGSE